ncbi:uncharacterized protein HVO_1919 [Haloferax volcanii DS2]|nr:uncharacterized protein HVO_1919 [Haloferax volcanii DS2]
MSEQGSDPLPDVDITDISPMAWRLLRVAAGYNQRAVERAVDDLMQAHVSMLESGSRGLSRSRRGTRRRTGPHARRTLLNRVGARRETPASVCRFRRVDGYRRRYTAVRYRIENN